MAPHEQPAAPRSLEGRWKAGWNRAEQVSSSPASAATVPKRLNPWYLEAAQTVRPTVPSLADGALTGVCGRHRRPVAHPLSHYADSRK